MQYLVFPDYWEVGAGPEPVCGPLEAADARTAYHDAMARNLYPAGVAFGLRVVGPYDMWSPICERQITGGGGVS
jgi:hypothetical protein